MWMFGFESPNAPSMEKADGTPTDVQDAWSEQASVLVTQ